jgi:hypothetical protein
MLTIPERLKDKTELYRRMMDEQIAGVRVSMPGIIRSFNPSTQTATIQLSIREKININGNLTWTEIPPLVDVPLGTIKGGGHLIVTAIHEDDECWVWFADMCIDATWQSGGIQNQIDKRRHDLSDSFFIPSLFSQPKKIANYPTEGIQLRNESGSSMVEVNGPTINIIGGNINIGSDTTIDGRSFLGHTHGGVEPGGGTTGGVT